MNGLGPRLVIAGAASGVGKTTVATGLMAALRARGLRVASAKVGPDFIDPGYHSIATGRPGRNLDAWISGPAAIAPLATEAGAHADLLIIEGVMGLFDGATDGTVSTTADVAKLLAAPVVLVIDAAAMSGSIAAVVHGYATFDPDLDIAGVIVNRVGSDNHETLLRDAIGRLGIPVLGALGRDDSMSWRDRHLGLVPVVEQRSVVQASVERLAQVISRSCNLDAIAAIGRAAPLLPTAPLPRPRAVGAARIAVPGGRAFSFTYTDNIEALQSAGAEIVPFDPIDDPALPAGIDGIYIGGGFPEVFVEALAANVPLLEDARARIGAGLTTWAECGGLLWLARSLDGHKLVGAIAADTCLTDHLTLGYVTATVRRANPVAPAGATLRGHEFHYSRIIPPGDALQLAGRHGIHTAGFASRSLLASYLHLHLGAAPHVAEHFVATSVDATPGGVGRARRSGTSRHAGKGFRRRSPQSLPGRVEATNSGCAGPIGQQPRAGSGSTHAHERRSAMKVVPVSGALGAEVTGVDLRAASDEELAQVRSGLHEFEVLFFRGADLTEEEQLAVGGRFGPVNLFPLAQLRGATEPTPMVITDGPDGPSTDHWHTDVTWVAEPPDYALLQALVVPERGGDTLWASMTTAYEALSPVMQALLVDLEVAHDNESFIAGVRAAGAGRPETDELADALRVRFPPVVHPLVRVHPDTGRRALFLGGGFMRGIQGMSQAESQALLDFLRRHIDDPRFHCRWRWQPGDLAIWDERSTNHRSAGDHFPQPRSVRRIEVGGARPHGVRAGRRAV